MWIHSVHTFQAAFLRRSLTSRPKIDSKTCNSSSWRSLYKEADIVHRVSGADAGLLHYTRIINDCFFNLHDTVFIFIISQPLNLRRSVSSARNNICADVWRNNNKYRCSVWSTTSCLHSCQLKSVPSIRGWGMIGNKSWIPSYPRFSALFNTVLIPTLCYQCQSGHWILEQL